MVKTLDLGLRVSAPSSQLCHSFFCVTLGKSGFKYTWVPLDFPCLSVPSFSMCKMIAIALP